jgi:hypothetical protein
MPQNHSESSKSDGLPVKSTAPNRGLQQLKAQLEVQKQKISDLEAKVEEQHKQEVDYQDTLLCVDRLWSQLNSDIAHIANRATGWQDPEPGSNGGDVGEPSTSDRPPADPFLEALLNGDASSAGAKVRKSCEANARLRRFFICRSPLLPPARSITMLVGSGRISAHRCLFLEQRLAPPARASLPAAPSVRHAE